MSLTDRGPVTIETVKAEIAEVDADRRSRIKALKALLRVLEAEEGISHGLEPENEQPKESAGKRGKKGGVVDG